MIDNKMSILILGGTGAMGIDLVKILAKSNYAVTVTSRNVHKSEQSINYIKGNAKDNDFLRMLLKVKWDCVIDFMSYGTDEFKCRADTLLSATDQYIYISSARVYAESLEPLTENSPRLLDICDDREYINTDEYALAKARQEDWLVKRATSNNFTIVRPSLTYNFNRLQFAMGEKEEWLYRALHNRSIVLPKDMLDIKTTMTYGYDVAVAISRLIGNKKSLGEVIHIASSEANTWGEILDIYQNVLEEWFGKRARVFMAGDSLEIASLLGRIYQIKYARGINRTFDNRKLTKIVGEVPFIKAEDGLKICLNSFLKNSPKFEPINWKAHAYFDLLTNEKTQLKEFSSNKNKLKYTIARYMPFFHLY